MIYQKQQGVKYLLTGRARKFNCNVPNTFIFVPMMNDDNLLTKNFINRTNVERNDEVFTYFEIPEIRDCRILMTKGLSNFKMQVHPKHEGEEFVELYMFLPSYWSENEWKESKNEWIFSCLSKAKNHVINSNVWYGHGHTFSTKIDGALIFNGIEQNDYIISNPIVLKDFLKPVHSNNRVIRFLAIIPIYKKEREYKEARGTFKLFEKFRQFGVTEKMDGYRESVMKSRWSRLFKR